MDNYFSRVKSIVLRLRDVLKCQKCLELKSEDLMVFYNVCDHFYCIDCIANEKTCLICEGPLDKPKNVSNDKYMLSLYQSLYNFELPSKEEVDRIYLGHTQSKENLESSLMNDEYTNEQEVNETADTPKKTNEKNLSHETPANQVKSGENVSNKTPTNQIKTKEKNLKNVTPKNTVKIIEKNLTTETPKNQAKTKRSEKKVPKKCSESTKLSAKVSPNSITEAKVEVDNKNENTVKQRQSTPPTESVLDDNEIIPDTPAVRRRRTKILSKERNNTSITTPSRRGKNTTPTTTPVVRGKNITAAVTPVNNKRNATLLASGTGSVNKTNSSVKKNVNKRNPKGETQLHIACKKSNFSAMTDLIAAGADPNAQDNAGWTPLHDSVFAANYEVIKFLLDNGAKVNAPGLENTTALHEAVAKGNVKVVELLLEYGADINAKNIFRETPLDIVTKYELGELKAILLEAQNNVKISSEEAMEVDKSEQNNIIIYKHELSIEDEKLVNKFVDKFNAKMIPSIAFKAHASHIVVPNNKFDCTWGLVSSVHNGCWIVTMDWIKDSLEESVLKPAIKYEPSKDKFSGFSKARLNKINQLPKLFSGCHFFFGGHFETYTIKNLIVRQEELKSFVENNGGITLKRCPDPESLALEKTVPFHADSSSSIRETSYYIIYQSDKWDPKPKYNMSHMKTLSVEWLICCIFKFELIDPNKKFSWDDFL